jgi:O-antigen/teichoic acid export membrane protein
VFSNKGGKVSISAGTGALVNFLLCLLLIPTIEYYGAGISLLISNLVSAFLNVYFLYRAKLSSIIKIFKILIIFALTLIFSLTLSLLYNYAIPRILLLLIPTALIPYTLFHAKELIRER